MGETLQGRGEVQRGPGHTEDGREQLKNYQPELGATSVQLCRRGDGLGAGLPSLARAALMLHGAPRCSVVKLVERQRSAKVSGAPVCSIS